MLKWSLNEERRVVYLTVCNGLLLAFFCAAILVGLILLWT